MRVEQVTAQNQELKERITLQPGGRDGHWGDKEKEDEKRRSSSGRGERLTSASDTAAARRERAQRC